MLGPRFDVGAYAKLLLLGWDGLATQTAKVPSKSKRHVVASSVAVVVCRLRLSDVKTHCLAQGLQCFV